jgi:trans-aconitate methyltransferase
LSSGSSGTTVNFSAGATLSCSVVDLDSSAGFVTSAKKLGLEVVDKSVYDLNFGPTFDAVLSNAALHWMKDAGWVKAAWHEHYVRRDASLRKSAALTA